MIFKHLLNIQSHPTWVRGLKQQDTRPFVTLNESHPTWVRGLKRGILLSGIVRIRSHPTWVRGLKPLQNKKNSYTYVVAPYVGAWIETVVYPLTDFDILSHPTWVRGLKPSAIINIEQITRSHPTWVRGLKLQIKLNLIIISRRTLRGCVD